MLIDFGRAADLDDAPLIHDGNAIGHHHSLVLVVGQDRDAGPFLQLLDLDLHGFAQRAVERTQGLIQQQKATRCCCPPDSARGFRSAKSASSTLSSISRARRAHSLRARPRIRSAKSTFAFKVMCGNRA